MRKFPLYPYQEDQVNFLLEPHESGWKLIVGPTGSGKSATIKCGVRLAYQRMFDSVLVLTPTLNLENNLLSPETYLRDTGTEVAFPVETWNMVLRDEGGSKSWDWAPGAIGIGTHSHAQRMVAPVGRDLRRALIVVDEAHHHGKGTKLYDFLVAAHKCGAAIWGFTATPERMRQEELAPVAMHTHVLSMVTLMACGWPHKINTRTVELATPSGKRAAGELDDLDYATIVPLLTSSSQRTLVVVSPGRSVELATELQKQINGAIDTTDPRRRVLVTTGEDQTVVGGITVPRPTLVNQTLAADRVKLAEGRWEETTWVLIDCRRCGEGTDIPALTRLMVYGVPSSLTALIQRVGRLLRRKDAIPNFPAEWMHTVEVILAVPTEADRTKAHTRAVEQLMLVACYLNSPEVAYDYLGFWEELRRDQRLPEHAKRALVAREVLPQQEALFRRQLLALGLPGAGRKHLTIAQFVEQIEVHVSDPTVAVELVDRLLQYGATNAPEIVGRLKEALAAVYLMPVAGGTPDQRADSRILYTNALLSRFKAVAQEFAHVVVPIDDLILRGMESTLTPEIIQQIGERLRRERDETYRLTFGQVGKLLTDFYAHNHRHLGMLKGVDEDLSPMLHYTFRQVDLERLIRRQWGETHGLTLAKVIALDWGPAKGRILTDLPVPVEALAKAWRARPLPTERDVVKALTSDATIQAALARDRHPKVLGESPMVLALAAWLGCRGIPQRTLLRDLLAGKVTLTTGDPQDTPGG